VKRRSQKNDLGGGGVGGGLDHTKKQGKSACIGETFSQKMYSGKTQHRTHTHTLTAFSLVYLPRKLEWSVFLSENGFMWEIKNIKATYIRQPIGVQLQLHSTILNFVFISIANVRMIALKIRQAAYIFHFI